MIPQLGMVGVTFRRGGQDRVAQFTLADGPTGDAELGALHTFCGFQESVYIATCNRVEIVFLSEHGVDAGRDAIYRFFQRRGCGEAIGDDATARRTLHAYEGEGAAEHLLCVAAALDAMNPGDAQILGQVKYAYQRAVGLLHVGPHLSLLFEEAFQTAKRVRRDTSIGTGCVSMVSLAAQSIDARYQRALAENRPLRLALVGKGDMAVQCAEMFAHRPRVELTWVNRTKSNIDPLAARFGALALSLADFVDRPPAVEVIVTSTSSQTPVFDEAFLARLVSASANDSLGCLIIDLGIPRDVERTTRTPYRVQILDIDDLERLTAQNRRARRLELAEARVIIDEALEALRKRATDRAMAPLICALRQHYTDTLALSLQQLRTFAESEQLGVEQRRVMEQWAHGMVNRLAHLPTVGLKRLAFEHGMEAVEAFLSGFADLAPAESLSPLEINDIDPWIHERPMHNGLIKHD